MGQPTTADRENLLRPRRPPPARALMFVGTKMLISDVYKVPMKSVAGSAA